MGLFGPSFYYSICFFAPQENFSLIGENAPEIPIYRGVGSKNGMPAGHWHFANAEEADCHGLQASRGNDIGPLGRFSRYKKVRNTR